MSADANGNPENTPDASFMLVANAGSSMWSGLFCGGGEARGLGVMGRE